MENVEQYKNRKFIENINFVTLIIFIIWYILPIAKAYFGGTIANIIMAIAILIFFMTAYMLNTKEFWKVGKHTIIVIICIIAYIINMFLRKDQGNPAAYAKVGIIFWIPVIMSNLYMHYYSSQKKKLLVYIIMLCFILTTIPTIIELSTNQGAIRELTYGGVDTVEDVNKIRKNVGTFSYVYGLSIIIPFLIYILLKTNKKKTVFVVLMLSVITLIEASFTIAIIITGISILIYYLTSRKNLTQKMIIISIAILVIIISYTFLPKLLISISENIDNKYFKQRIVEIADFIGGNENGSGDLSSRLELYQMSLHTFLEHPIIGVGGYYYIEYNNPGIGYHSEILDNMARYGIFSLVFVISFFYYYRRYLLQISDSENEKRIINTIIYSILILALINPCFNNEWISIIAFVLLPTYCSLRKGDFNGENSKKNSENYIQVSGN